MKNENMKLNGKGRVTGAGSVRGRVLCSVLRVPRSVFCGRGRTGYEYFAHVRQLFTAILRYLRYLQYLRLSRKKADLLVPAHSALTGQRPIRVNVVGEGKEYRDCIPNPAAGGFPRECCSLSRNAGQDACPTARRGWMLKPAMRFPILGVNHFL